MTTPTPGRPPVNPGYPPQQWTAPAAYTQPPTTPPPAPRKRRVLIWVGLALAAIVGLGLAGGILSAAQDLGKTSAPTNAAPLPQDKCGGGVCDAGTAAQPAVTTAAAPVPHAPDFELTPKIRSKQCFGSAGCLVDVQIKVGYDGAPLSDDDTWQVTYELTGDESGPIIGSFEVTGSTYDENTESLSTKSSRTKIKIKVTDVEKVGL